MRVRVCAFGSGLRHESSRQCRSHGYSSCPLAIDSGPKQSALGAQLQGIRGHDCLVRMLVFTLYPLTMIA